MEKTKKDVSQKFKRFKHEIFNNSKKDDDWELKAVAALEQRNQKVIAAVATYKKNVANTIKTGLREENVDKRRKKLDEFSLCLDLREGSTDLASAHSTCLHNVMNKIAQALQVILEEKVDFEIARKALEKSADITQQQQLQDTYDASAQKLENQKDNTITDIFTLASKEQEIAKSFAALLEEELEYHRTAMRTIEMILPDVRRDIDNARPRPVFGVDLTEHLRHTNTRTAVVIEKCCTMLRNTGFKDKGLFRVNGNNTKIRRMKAAFDAGQIDLDEAAYVNDPFCICSVLKCYLRELPDPLLTNRLFHDWVAASKKEGEERLRAIEACIVQLPAAHRHNLTYLVHFLSDMLQYEDITSMNAGNLAIVMGPNLLGGDLEGNNAVGTKIVETLLKNANRFFGIPEHERKLLDRSESEYLGSSPQFRSDTGSWGVSPRTRPKEKAPPPPVPSSNSGRNSDLLIDYDDDSLKRNNGQMSNKPHVYEHVHQSGDNSFESDGSFSEEAEDGIHRSDSDKKPSRPPPPTYRANYDNISLQNRPMSYNLAVGTAGIEPPPRTHHHSHSLSQQQLPMVIENPMLAAKNSSKPSDSLLTERQFSQPEPLQQTENREIKKPTVMQENLIGKGVGVTDTLNRTVVSIDSSGSSPIPPLKSSKPPLPTKPKPNDKESSRL
ncbi:hypothetical protein WR25_04786 [Diploscapter pachys]|uniref:Rho-GAP domain-containing protein n=1 Tax=Diploscapter pachys TaxID=2018661 RepID=A0A2A2LH08_9BILA|nr:hypothetical protein WR25_04786 [Diploscapter pachys]